MHFDTITLRPKNVIWKVDGYNIISVYMFPQENEYKSLLPRNAHGSPNFDKAACTISLLLCFKYMHELLSNLTIRFRTSHNFDI